MRGHAERMVQYRVAVLALVALVTLALGWQLPGLRIVVDPDELLPHSHPFQIATSAIERIFGNKYLVVVAVTAREGTVFQQPVLSRVRTITDALAETPGVIRRNVLSLSAPLAKSILGTDDGLDVRPLMESVPSTPEGLRALEAAFDANPAYHGLLVSADRRTAAITAEFNKDPGGFRVVAARINALVEPLRGPEVEILVGGQPIIVGLIETFSDRMAFFFPLALVLIGIIHWEAFRSLQAMILPLVTAVLAVIWSLGLLRWTGTTLDTFNATTPILILAVAAGHAVQILKRYYECYVALRSDGALDPREANRRAVVEAVTGVGPIMLAAGSIAAISFCSLLVFEVRTIQVFGVFTALGIASAVVIELTFTPALRAMLPPPPDAVTARELADTRWDRLARRLANLVITRPRRVIAVGGAITAALCAAATLVYVDNATSAFLFRSLPALEADRTINRRLAGTNTFQVLIEGEDDAIKDPGVLAAMQATQRFLEREPQIGKTLSIVDFLVRINAALNPGDAGPSDVPRTSELVAQYLLLYSMSGDPGDFDHYVDYPYRTAVITGYMREESSAYLIDLDRRLRAFVAATFPATVRVSIGGTVMQPVALNQVIVASKLLNIAQICACVFVVSALLFRSVLAGLLVLVPLVSSVAAIFGVMGLTAIPLQMATATVSALAVGIGADYAIYFLYRLRDANRGSTDLATAMEQAFASAGKAVMFVATAVAGGYAVLMASWGFLIHIWLGALIAMAMVISAASALTVMPALIVLLRPRFLFDRVVPAAAKAVARLLLLGALVGSGFVGTASAQSADQIMERNFVTMRVRDSVANVTFRLINASGQERVRQTISRTMLRENGSDSMRVARFMSPADIRGTVVLMIENLSADDDMWIYLPAARRVRRLVAANRRDAFVGSDFTYGDIIGHRVSEWTHRLTGEEAVNGRPAWIVESLPRSPVVQSNTGYSRRVQWIDKENYVATRGEAYDEGGRLLRRFSASDVRLVDPAARRFQPMTMEAQNVQSNHRTVIRFENFRANQGMSAEYFTTRAMERDE